MARRVPHGSKLSRTRASQDFSTRLDAAPLPRYGGLVRRTRSETDLAGIPRGTVRVCRMAGSPPRLVDCRKVTAAFDTGAAKTVVPSWLVPSPPFSRGVPEQVRGVGRKRVATTLVAIQAPSCRIASVSAWVDDQLAAIFHTDVVIGDDYMEAVGLVPDPSTRTGTCAP